MRNNMSLSPWNDISRIWSAMDGFWPSRDFELLTASFPIDMYKENDRVIVRASTPGVKPEDLNVSLEYNVLTISGESNQPYEDNRQSTTYHREHSYGKFVRSVRLPGDVNEEEIDAQLENGILTVSIPIRRPQNQQPRQIPIKSQGSASKSIGSGAYADSPKSMNDGNSGNLSKDTNSQNANSGNREPTKAR
jgi:HSP20 family protein